MKLLFTVDYSPELDSSEELDIKDAAYYQSHVGILRWGVEMGRIDIRMEVSVMSSYVALPQYDHFLQVLHIFAYLQCHHAAMLVFNPLYPGIDDDQLIRKIGMDYMVMIRK